MKALANIALRGNLLPLGSGGLMLRMFLGVVTLASAIEAVAQTPPAAPPQPTVWDLEWELPHCTIATATKDGSALMLEMTPGDPEPSLYFMQPGKQVQVKAGEEATVIVQPSGKTVRAPIWRQVDGTKVALGVGPLGHQFPAEFAQASSVSVQTAEGRASIPTTGSDKAMAAIRQCTDKKLTEWGIDVAAYNALQKAPTSIKGYSWLDPNDYPMDAIESNWSGAVIARMDVDATGKVTNCKIVVSGGMRSVDDMVCRSALKKGRFEPAAGADGKPTAAARIVSVVFRVFTAG